ncbi:hypothetical protein KV580_27035 [Pseudomonas chlororaphis]|nr:hypothetical protein [Pseudomonas chlororaphis]
MTRSHLQSLGVPQPINEPSVQGGLEDNTAWEEVVASRHPDLIVEPNPLTEIASNFPGGCRAILHVMRADDLFSAGKPSEFWRIPRESSLVTTGACFPLLIGCFSDK